MALNYTSFFIVEDKHLATHWGNLTPVLATPIILWWCELACMHLSDKGLASGLMSVGYGHDMKHLKPSPLGARIQVEVCQLPSDSKFLFYSVQAFQGDELVASGTHTRALVKQSIFSNFTKG